MHQHQQQYFLAICLGSVRMMELIDSLVVYARNKMSE